VALYSTTLSPSAIYSHFLAMATPSAPPAAPAIAWSLAGTQLTLSWPAAGVTVYTLESTASLTAPAWTPVTGVANNQITFDASKGSRFYRLQH
jgi:hypothetical protein